jgi:two-component system phosphate regulon sensor histidine kinase PhoR
MSGHRLFWRLYRIFLLVILIGAPAFAWYAVKSLRETTLDRATTDLRSQTLILRKILTGQVGPESTPQLDSLLGTLAAGTSTDISVLVPPGRVIADSRGRSSLIHDQANRPEIIAALSGEIGIAMRYSYQDTANVLYAAAPIPAVGNPTMVVRTEMSLKPLETTLESLRRWLLAGTLALLLVSALLCWLIERSIIRPLDLLRVQAQQLAAGDSVARIDIGGGTASEPLAAAVNEMARQLNDRIQTVTRQRNEQEAILTSMAEGVLAVDTSERVININQAAVRLIGLSAESVKGRPIVEVIRNSELQALVTNTLQSRAPLETDIVLTDGGERHFQAHGMPLRDADGNALGALVVLNDITRLRRLENMRRDFVANVSHELKTPITSIKGFVETLRDAPAADPAETHRFLEIISKHADRLNSIIEDLLTLSRIEQEAESAQIPLEHSAIAPVLQSAVHACESKAADKQISVSLICDKSIAALINAPLLEQAVINLIDNGIKYSESGSAIEVIGRAVPAETVISVRDQGCGIGHEHLSRIFERFYRVDKARSRRLGGTGLGLAIVKHIVIAHNGSVSVESALGKGTEFSIHLPS